LRLSLGGEGAKIRPHPMLSRAHALRAHALTYMLLLLCVVPSYCGSAGDVVGSLTATQTTVTQTITDTNLQAAAYIDPIKKVYECAYAYAVDNSFCTSVGLSTNTYKEGVTLSSDVNRRSAQITMRMTVTTTAKPVANLQIACSALQSSGALFSTAVNVVTVAGSAYTAIQVPVPNTLTISFGPPSYAYGSAASLQVTLVSMVPVIIGMLWM